MLIFSPSVIDAPYRNLISACVLLNVGIAFSEEHALYLVAQVLSTTTAPTSTSEEILLQSLSRFHRSIQLSGSFLSKRINKLLQYTYSLFSPNKTIDSSNSNTPIHRQAAIDRKEQLLELLCEYIKASSIGRSVFSEHIPKLVPVISTILDDNSNETSSKIKALLLLKQLVLKKADRPSLIRLGGSSYFVREHYIDVICSKLLPSLILDSQAF